MGYVLVSFIIYMSKFSFSYLHDRENDTWRAVIWFNDDGRWGPIWSETGEYWRVTSRGHSYYAALTGPPIHRLSPRDRTPGIVD